MTGTHAIDLRGVVQILGTHPPGDALDRLAELGSGGLATLDVWVLDIQGRHLTSLRSGRQAAEPLDDRTSVELSHHGNYLGLVTLDGPRAGTDTAAAETLRMLAPLLAMWLSTWFGVSDVPWRATRTRPMSLPAEMQAAQLPPPGYADDRTIVSAAVEPAYDTGGDIYDYAVNGDTLLVAVLDAMGHGLGASVLSALAAAALRNARRQGASLIEQCSAVDHAVRARHADQAFVSAVLAEIDLSSGACRWVTAGHLPPLLVGDGALQELPVVPGLPLGLRIEGDETCDKLVVQETVLEAGTSLVLYSDGVVENISVDDGGCIGRARVDAALIAHVEPASTTSARAVVDDLLTVTGAELRDDATVLVAHRLAG